jgi:hypothetical protein
MKNILKERFQKLAGIKSLGEIEAGMVPRGNDTLPKPSYKEKADDERRKHERDVKLETELLKYVGQTFASWMSPSSRIGGEFIDNPPFSQEYAKPPYINKLVTGIIDIVNGEGFEEKETDISATDTGTKI